MKPAIIVDIDNVLMDARIPDKTQPNVRTDREAWRKWQPEMEKCEKILDMFHLVKSLTTTFPAITIFLVTSRESTKELVEITQRQMNSLTELGAILLMRAEDDCRTSSEVKRNLYESAIKGRYRVMVAIDDLEENIKMWQSLGIKTLQFRYGDENNG